MEPMTFLPALKQFVLVLFFASFSGIILWAGNVRLEDKRYLPLEEDPK